MLQAAFPAVGAIALAGVLGEMLERVGKVQEAFQKLHDAPARIANEFDKLTQPLQLQNAELNVANDKLENEIAKIQGKPQNGLKLALDDAVASSLKLSESLRSNFDDLANLFEKESNKGFLDKLAAFTEGEASTDSIRAMLVGNTGLGGTKANIERITADYDSRIASAKTGDDAKALAGQKYKAIQEELAQALQKVNTELTKRLALQKEYDSYGSNGNRLLAEMGGAYVPGDESVKAIPELTKSQAFLKDLSANYLIASRNSELQGQFGGLKADKSDAYANALREENAQLDEALAKLKAIEDGAPKQLAEAFSKANAKIQEVNASLKRTHEGSLSLNQILTLQGKALQTGAVEEYATALEKLDQRNKKLDELAAQNPLAKSDSETNEKVDQLNRETAAYERLAAAWLKGPQAGKAAQDLIAASKYDNATEAAAAQRETDAKQKAQETEETTKLVEKLNLETDAVKRLTAAQNLGIDAQRAAERANILNSFGLNPDSNQQRQIQAHLDLLNAQNDSYDKQNMRGDYGSASNGFLTFFEQMNNNTKTAAQNVHDILGGAFNDLNNDLTRMVEGQKVNWSSFFRDIAGSIEKAGLNAIEGKFSRAVLAAMGGGDDPRAAAFGGGVVGSSSGGGFLKGIGGLLGSLFGVFGGARASGGDVDSDKAYLVGENGPEILTGASGSILPNRALAGGGGGTVYMDVDARGTNAADVEMRIQRFGRQMFPQAVRVAAITERESRLRRPLGSKS